MLDLARRLAIAREDEPAHLLIRGGRVLSVSTLEWLEVRVDRFDVVPLAAEAA